VASARRASLRRGSSWTAARNCSTASANRSLPLEDRPQVNRRVDIHRVDSQRRAILLHPFVQLPLRRGGPAPGCSACPHPRDVGPGRRSSRSASSSGPVYIKAVPSPMCARHKFAASFIPVRNCPTAPRTRRAAPARRPDSGATRPTGITLIARSKYSIAFAVCPCRAKSSPVLLSSSMWSGRSSKGPAIRLDGFRQTELLFQSVAQVEMCHERRGSDPDHVPGTAAHWSAIGPGNPVPSSRPPRPPAPPTPLLRAVPTVRRAVAIQK